MYLLYERRDASLVKTILPRFEEKDGILHGIDRVRMPRLRQSSHAQRDQLLGPAMAGAKQVAGKRIAGTTPPTYDIQQK